MTKVQLNILNMKNFLETVNDCAGEIFLIRTGEGRVSINKKETIQERLWQEYHQNKNYLPLTLEIPDPGDYRKIIFYYIGDC